MSGKEKPPDKNWGSGRQCPPGLRMAELDDPAIYGHFLKHITEDHKLWPFGLVEFGTQIWKAADALSIKDSVPYQMRHSGPSIDISKQSRSLDAIMKREMAKRQNSDEVRETCAIGSGASIVQRHADRTFREVRRSARGGDPWARRARRCAAARKSEVMVGISEGGGQVGCSSL